MDYLKTYKRFIYGHYLTSGVRITIGIVLPAVVMNYFGLLTIGIVMSLGAMCVSSADNPGPIKHRRNTMLICMLLIFGVSLTTCLAQPYPILLGGLIVVFCFAFSMIGVYGLNANTIGLAVLLVMVLNLGQHYEGTALLLHATYILAGGLWYMLLSLLLHGFRPYKLAQQALGDCILATSDYLRIRASFYDREVKEEEVYKQMLEQQIRVHEKQMLVRELLFKSRDVVKSSTPIGRTLVIMFLDTVDLFEKAMASYYDYKTLHHSFEKTDIMHRYRQLVILLAQELDDIGIAIQSGYPAKAQSALPNMIKETRSYLAGLRDKKRTATNLADFIQLRHILQGIEDISSRIHRLRLYTTYDKALVEKLDPSTLEYDKFISQQDVNPKLLFENFTLKSNIFRHALRVSIATLVGYIISLFLTLGHSYWILLTIIVILKPNYSLTKKRNSERLLGTIAGALIGLVILYFIKDRTALFVVMLFLMTGAFAFLRPKYMIGVIFMTPYVLILFHLLYGSNTQVTLTDRVIDTAIASVIAFLANVFLVPAWEQEQIKNYMLHMIEDNMAYFKDISCAFTGKPTSITQYKLSRKNAFVSLANLSDAFSRMLMEPKNKQKNSQDLHQFVVLNHMLTSHIATLSHYASPLSAQYASEDFNLAINYIITQLKEAKEILNKEKTSTEISTATLQRGKLEKRVETLMEKRRNELEQGILESETRKTLSEFKSIVDQFDFISGIAGDIKKASIQLA